MKLFLASLASTTLDLIKPLLPKNNINSLKVACIPTAADPYETHPWLDADRAKLISMGFLVTDYDIKGKTADILRHDLADFQVIFVGGGNTFYLLDHVRKSSFDIIIRELLARGVVYIGSSAGSIIMGPTVEFFKSLDSPVPELTDFRGLNLCHPLIIPHFGREKYAERHAKLLTELQSRSLPYPILPLRDDQAVIVNGNQIDVVSRGQTP